MYKKVYEFLKFNRRKENVDNGLIQTEIKKMVGGDKAKMNHCFNLDGIVFMEIIRE